MQKRLTLMMSDHPYRILIIGGSGSVKKIHYLIK